MSFGNTKLSGMLQGERDQLASCVKLLLLWVAASDGTIDESELAFVSDQLPDSDETVTREELLSVIRESDLGSIEMAIRTLAAESRELRMAFLDMAIAMSIADRRMAFTENHILRFYADALYLGLPMLEKRFQAIAGVSLGEPGDPGDPNWWKEAERGRGDVAASNAKGDMTPEQARAVLGVADDATPEDIDRARDGLAAIFHLERVEAMGDAAVAVATRRLRRIDRAHGMLRGAA